MCCSILFSNKGMFLNKKELMLGRVKEEHTKYHIRIILNIIHSHIVHLAMHIMLLHLISLVLSLNVDLI